MLNYLAKFNPCSKTTSPTLRRVLWCGEVLPTPALIYWMERLPKVHFSNLYGPTEATIASSYYDVTACPTDPKSAIPIGTPCDGEDLLVLNDKLATDFTFAKSATFTSRAPASAPAIGATRRKPPLHFFPTPKTPDATRLYRTGDLA